MGKCCASTTRLLRTSRGLPSNRQDPKGEMVRYGYDKALRLTSLVNENNATYSFAYDVSDRLIEEVRVDNLTRRFSYNVGGHLTRLDEIGYGENAERPERHTLFERDAIGRLVAKINRDASQTFAYDDGDRLLSIERQPTGIGKQLGITEEKLEYAYDLLGRLTQEITSDGTLSYEYDPLSNLTTLTLPDGRKVNHLYYGSGHLHQLNLSCVARSSTSMKPMASCAVVIPARWWAARNSATTRQPTGWTSMRGSLPRSRTTASNSGGTRSTATTHGAT